MQVNYLEYLRTVILERKPCVICGELAQTVHHKDENQDNNDTENYLDVCRKCDLLIKHKKKPNEYKSIPKFKKALLSTKICPQCKKKFNYRKNKVFCSAHCRFRNWNLQHPRLSIDTNRELAKAK